MHVFLTVLTDWRLLKEQLLLLLWFLWEIDRSLLFANQQASLFTTTICRVTVFAASASIRDPMLMTRVRIHDTPLTTNSTETAAMQRDAAGNGTHLKTSGQEWDALITQLSLTNCGETIEGTRVAAFKSVCLFENTANRNASRASGGKLWSRVWGWGGTRPVSNDTANKSWTNMESNTENHNKHHDVTGASTRRMSNIWTARLGYSHDYGENRSSQVLS